MKVVAHRGLSAPRNRSRYMSLFGFVFVLLCAAAFSAPPYDATIVFTFPDNGTPIDSVDLYINDCAAGSPVGAPFGTITSGQTLPALITVDGVYEFCVRGVNAAGQSAGPGAVWVGTIAQLPIPPNSDSINVQIPCDTPCIIQFTIEQR